MSFLNVVLDLDKAFASYMLIKVKFHTLKYFFLSASKCGIFVLITANKFLITVTET